MKLIRRIIYCFLLCLSIWAAGLFWFIGQIPSDPSNETQEADAIIVLTGGSGRLEHGLDLLAQGKGKVLFISGVSKKTQLGDLLHYAPPGIRSNVASKPIILGHDAENTIGNAKETTEWLHREGHRTIYLVTSNYHMPRSLAEFQEITSDFIFIPTPVFPEEFKRSGWWKDRYSRTMILLEYHKLLASKLRHWLVSTAHKPQ